MNLASDYTHASNIKRPEIWELALRVCDTGVNYTLHTPLEDNSLIVGEAMLERTTESFLNRLENLFYDVPILVDEYRKVRVLYDTDIFVIIPDEFYSEEGYEDIFRVSFPEFSGEILSSHLLLCKAYIVYGIPKGVSGFLSRTYPEVTINHSMMSLCEFFGKRSRLGNVNKMCATIIGRKLFLTGFNKDGLIAATSFSFRHVNDAAFFILSVWKENGLDVFADELQLAGNQEVRKEIIPILRQYITYVMPSLFPNALLKTGKEAMNAPFDLMILSLCE